MKKAFTLAETLITVTIIGIIASLMMAQLSKVKPDENAMLYKKSFYTIQDVVRTLANDVDKYPDSSNIFMTKPTNASEGSYQLYFCNNVYNELNTVGQNNCSSNALNENNGTFSDGKYDFKLTNGMWFSGFNQTYTKEDGSQNSITICVDTNGNKGPNVGCTGSSFPKNRDQYKIRINFDGKVTTGSGDDWNGENAILENTGIVTK